MVTHVCSVLVLGDDIADPKLRRVHETFDFMWRNRPLRCPAGMPTDGGSIPRLGWRLFGNPWQRPLDQAFVPHDGAYNGLLVDWDNNPVYLTQAEADLMLQDIGLLVYLPGTRKWLEPARHAAYVVKVRSIYGILRAVGRVNYHGSAPT